MNIYQKERIFFFTHAITILSLFTYSVCDEKVKKAILRVLRMYFRNPQKIVMAVRYVAKKKQDWEISILSKTKR